ncbi:TadE family type IV pilus minor pilin [Dactylosporangium sp. CA-139066]|uniref:TadE family type IV pilus minor pilin n=1 Tax=Dactylosporangium sp. CA-139066 TaxID=3239930 RepID=UPI003D8B916B
MTARGRVLLPLSMVEFRPPPVRELPPGPESVEVFRAGARPAPGLVEFRAAPGTGGELLAVPEPEPVEGAVRGHRAGRGRRRRGKSRHRRGGDRGSATLEVALMVPVVLLFLAACVMAIGALGTKISCVDAAGTAVRAVARGEPVPDFGGGTDVAVEHDGDVVRVIVRMKVPAPMLAGFTVEERAVAMVEPQTGTGP